jgi:hypothetical protein
MRARCITSYRLIVPITMIGELIYHWAKMPRNHEEYKRSATVKSSRRRHLAVCIFIITAALRDYLSGYK